MPKYFLQEFLNKMREGEKERHSFMTCELECFRSDENHIKEAQCIPNR